MLIRLLVLLMFLTAFPVVALHAQEQEKDKKVTVINGKKFFTLRSARRFYGDSKLAPIAVQKYVRNPALNYHGSPRSMVKTPENKPDTSEKTVPAVPPLTVAPTPYVAPAAPPLKVTAPIIAPAIAPPMADIQPASVPKPNEAASKVLSIFEPEDKAVPATLTNR